MIPTPETYNGNVNPVGPRSCYDEAKRCGESYVIAYRTQHNLDTRIVRIFNTYGPKMRPDDIYGRVVPRFIEQALGGKPITVFGDGSQKRSFCFVLDTVDAMIRMMNQDGFLGPLNIGRPNETSILELAHLILDLTSSKSKIEFRDLPKDDPVRREPDISLAKHKLNWEPKVGLKSGLLETIAYFKKKI